MSAGTATARRPSAVTSLATSSRRDAVRAASTTSAPARALASAIDAPQVRADPGDHDHLARQQASGSHQPSILAATAAWRAAIRAAYSAGVTRACWWYGSRPGRSANGTTSARGPSAGPRSRVSRCQRICT